MGNQFGESQPTFKIQNKIDWPGIDKHGMEWTKIE